MVCEYGQFRKAVLVLVVYCMKSLYRPLFPAQYSSCMSLWVTSGHVAFENQMGFILDRLITRSTVEVGSRDHEYSIS